jgi:hypothetical protein
MDSLVRGGLSTLRGSFLAGCVASRKQLQPASDEIAHVPLSPRRMTKSPHAPRSSKSMKVSKQISLRTPLAPRSANALTGNGSADRRKPARRVAIQRRITLANGGEVVAEAQGEAAAGSEGALEEALEQALEEAFEDAGLEEASRLAAEAWARQTTAVLNLPKWRSRWPEAPLCQAR